MPELPEVESLRRGLLTHVVGKTIKSVDVLLPKLVSGRGTSRTASEEKTNEFIAGATNKKITDIKRRAKNLIFELSDGGIILVHLKMTGQLVYKENTETVWGGHPIELSDSKLPNKHSYIIFKLDKGNLYYNDVRQFGYLLYFSSYTKLDAEDHFKGLGVEPHSKEFTLEHFKTNLKKKTGVLKKVLLEQSVVVGLGNIYADEVCFEAGIRPMRTIKSLKKIEIENLYKAIKRILPRAIELGGSSVANYLLADGSRGNYANEHKVYKRADLPCFVCGTMLTKVQCAGRTTVYCTICQK